MVIGLDEGQPLAIRGEAFELPGVIRQRDRDHQRGHARRRVHDADASRTGSQHAYIRKTVHISANVAPATHGETIHSEVLGGGDGAPNQRFSLRRPPLTHVSAPTPAAPRARSSSA